MQDKILEGITTEILKFHKQFPIIDGHGDIFGWLLNNKASFFARHVRQPADYRRFPNNHDCSPYPQMDYRSLLMSGTTIQFAAIYTPIKYQKQAATDYALQMLGLIRQTVQASRNRLHLITNRAELAKAKPISFIMVMENGSPLAGDLNLLPVFYKLGVRCLVLTQNRRNELGDGVRESNPKGLTPFGKSVVRECERLGIIVDVAHLAPDGIKDVVRIARKPIIASHSGIKALCDVPRNLADRDIKLIAQTGGVIGIFNVPDFLRVLKDAKDFISPRDVVRHIAYVVDKVGIEHVGLGLDFDGYGGTVYGLEQVAQIPNLTYELKKWGFNKSEIYKILFGNFHRVLKTLLPVT
jgi:membrane dipeptidase